MPVYFNCSTIPIKQTGKVPKDIDFYTFGSLVHPRVGWLGWWWPANSINFQANILGHDKLWMGWGVPIVHIFKSLHDGAQPIKNSNHESSSLVVMDRHVLSYFWHPSRVYDFRIKGSFINHVVNFFGYFWPTFMVTCTQINKVNEIKWSFG